MPDTLLQTKGLHGWSNSRRDNWGVDLESEHYPREEQIFIVNEEESFPRNVSCSLRCCPKQLVEYESRQLVSDRMTVLYVWEPSSRNNGQPTCSSPPGCSAIHWPQWTRKSNRCLISQFLCCRLYFLMMTVWWCSVHVTYSILEK